MFFYNKQIDTKLKINTLPIFNLFNLKRKTSAPLKGTIGEKIF